MSDLVLVLVLSGVSTAVWVWVLTSAADT